MQVCNYIKAFGFINGFLLYCKFKFGLTDHIKLPGFKYPLYFRPKSVDKYTFEEIFINKDYEFNIPVKLSNFPLVIDAGANIGYASLYFLNKIKNARLFCIEPDEENHYLLEKNLSFYPNVNFFKGALWWHNTNIIIKDEGYGTRGYVVKETNQPGNLKAITVAEIMKGFNYNDIDILKMDIEGSEKEIFSYNYENWLPFTKCLILEMHDFIKAGCSKAVFRAISQYDFSIEISGENLVCFNNNYL